MKDKVKEKSCNNCRSYSQHYSRQGTKFEKVFCGHCLNPDNRKKRKPLVLCEHWENIVTRKEERRKSIKEVLTSMSGHLNEIALILETDKE